MARKVEIMTVERSSRRKSDDATTLPSEATVPEAVELLTSHRIGALPVMENGKVVGISSERDTIHCLQESGIEALGERVADFMTAQAVTIAGEDSVIGAVALMTQRRIRHLPVVEDGRLTGLVSIGDLVKYRIDRIEDDAASLRSYIQSA